MLSSTQAEEEFVENVTIQNNVDEPQYFDYPSDDFSNEDMEYDPTNDYTSESDSDENLPDETEIILEDIIIPTQAELYLIRIKKNKKMTLNLEYKKNFVFHSFSFFNFILLSNLN